MEINKEKLFLFCNSEQTVLLDPLTKMIVLVIVATLTMSGEIVGMKIYARLLLALLPGVLLFTTRKLQKISRVYVCAIGLGWTVESFFALQVTGLLGMLLLIVSGLITRFLPSLLMGYYFISSTQVDELIAALQQWRVPKQLTIPLAVMFRFVPTIKEEASSIRDAMRMRHIGGIQALKNPVKYLEYQLVPLMASIVRIGDDLSAAALTRGLGGRATRSSIYDVKFHVSDYLLLLTAFLLLFGYMYL